MAIISIPTSVSGSSIPSGLIVGPLGALYHNPSAINFHKYPQDLETSNKGHVVQLVIKEIQPIKLDDITSAVSRVADQGGELIKELPQNVSNVVGNAKDVIVDEIGKATSIGGAAVGIGMAATEAVSNAGKATGDKLNELWNSKINITNESTTPVAYISLYMPDTMNFTYNTMYDKVTVTNAAAEALGLAKDAFNKVRGNNGGTGIVSKLAGGLVSIAKDFMNNKNSLATMLLKNSGYAINPQQSMLFNGVDLRRFQLAFVFTPTSADEAREVEEIIKLIKAHSRPEQYTGGFGMFFKPPSIFSVKFLFNGLENTRIPKVHDCIIESVDVNYAPNGWAAHIDGSPVQTTLTIGLMERHIVDKTEILQEGY